ncbi:MAG: glutathione S-transferase N-terminal domain-containing protein [Paracoccaceae bacterium]
MPNGPAGLVRDLRLRWACEEAGLPYQTRSITFNDRHANHLDRQPFGQVPFMTDGDIRMFESGACLLHLAAKAKA